MNVQSKAEVGESENVQNLSAVKNISRFCLRLTTVYRAIQMLIFLESGDDTPQGFNVRISNLARGIFAKGQNT